MHFEIIGQHHSVITHTVTQQVRNDHRRQGCRELLVEGTVENVRRHDRRDTLSNSMAKRRKLDQVQSLAWNLHDREFLVRISVGVAMARKMFPASHNLMVLESGCRCPP